MKQQILHTPEGVRDIYGVEFRKKLVLEKRLQQVLHLYGYHDIQTPMFEFFDVFGKEIGTIPSNELYKFFDRDGNTLVLRPDITPSIARAATTLFDRDYIQLRLCYTGNTFINHSSYKGKLKENTQLGAELIGIDSAEADAEMIALAVDCLKEAGLEEFQIHIGNVVFFQSLIEDAQLNEEGEQRLRELISNRNYFGVDELLEETGVPQHVKEAFRILPELVGEAEILNSARKIAPNQKALSAIKRLETTYQTLAAYGVEDYVTFDLSMSGTYGYYTGIIFRGYTYGTGDAVVKGGRYDHLMEKFGKESPSIGFVIVIDELMNAFNRQKVEIPYDCKNTLILYDEGRREEAISLVKEFRKKGKPTALVNREKEKTEDDYISYAKQTLCGSMLYLKDTKEIMMKNLMSGESKVILSKVK